MKYAIYLPNFGGFGSARVMADLARDAENAGWDGFFMWDHIAADFPADMVDPWVALGAIAMHTERIRIGTTVTPIPRRRPWKLARETVSVDRLSNGRLTLGVGIGLGAHEWDHLGEETDSENTRRDAGRGTRRADRVMARGAVQLRGRTLSRQRYAVPPDSGPDAARPDLGRRILAEQSADAPRRALGWRVSAGRMA